VPAASTRVFTDDSAEPRVRGFLQQPETPTGHSLVLTHGAGSNAAAPLLIALADVFTTAGFTVLRCDLPYRQARPYGPPGPGDAARDRAGLSNAITTMKKIIFGRIFLGGHSYGGRQASMLCAEQPELVSGLLLLSYPLHPPRKPDQLRTQHLFNLQVPTLFVHGERDPFGTLAEIESALKLIPAETRLLPVEGAGHDLGFKGKARPQDIPQKVLKEFTNFL
jgi:uncharacterized protein